MFDDGYLRPVTGITLLLVFIGLVYGCIQFGYRLPQVPYNVRELFPDSHRNLSVAVFSLLLVWLGLAPAWVSNYLVCRPRYLPLMPLCAVGIGAMSWLLLDFSVTRESVWDIVGSPTLGWSGDWELFLRFLALQGIAMFAFLISGVFVGSCHLMSFPTASRRGLLTLFYCVPWLALCWTVVVGWASTDNLTELIRGTPRPWIGPLFLSVLMIMVGASASALGYVIARRSVLGTVLFALAALLLVVPGWELLWLGLDPAVEKYGVTFPAARFLLGPNRETTLSISELFFRWGGLQAGCVFLLAGACTIGLLFRPRASKVQTGA